MKSLDIFSRRDDEEHRTKFGGLGFYFFKSNRSFSFSNFSVTCLAILIMFMLFISETSLYISPSYHPRLKVDDEIHGKMFITFNITFPELPCIVLSVNAFDKAGNHELNIHHDVYTQRLDRNGDPIKAVKEVEIVGGDEVCTIKVSYNLFYLVGGDEKAAKVKLNETKECGNCYGAQTSKFPCCNTCEEVRNAYHDKGWIFSDATGIEQCVKESYLKKITDQQQQHEGCNVHGQIETQRGIGNFNIVVGDFIIQNSKYLFDSGEFKQFMNKEGGHYALNASHIVHHLSFGQVFPGQLNPLDGKVNIQNFDTDDASIMYEYYVKVVPTKFQNKWGNGIISSNQYSVTEFSQKLNLKESVMMGAPGVVFLYELSPISVDFSIKRMNFFHFVTNLLAVLGGIFTVSSLLDKFVFNIGKKIMRRDDLVK